MALGVFGGNVLKFVKAFSTILLSCTLVIAGCIGGGDPHQFNGESPGEGKAAPFTLLDQKGEQWSLSQIEGNVTIVSFIFTRCPDICITSSLNIKFVLSELSQEERESVQLVSITVDPWHDTPEKMGIFADDRTTGWPHLTSSNAGDLNQSFPELEEIWGNYNVSLETYDAGGGEYLIQHSLPIYMLDREHNKRVVWLGSDWDPFMFKQDLVYLIHENE